MSEREVFLLPLISAVLVAGGAFALDQATKEGTPYRQVVEERIETEFRERYRQGITVTCPEEPKEKDHEFLCDGETEGGEKGKLRVHETDADGGFEWDVVENTGDDSAALDRLAESTLRAGQLAEEAYFRDHHAYTKDVAQLTAFTVPDGVAFRIVRADAAAYCLEAKAEASEHAYTLSNDGGEPVRDGAC